MSDRPAFLPPDIPMGPRPPDEALVVLTDAPPVPTLFAAAWPSRTWQPAERVTAGMMNTLRDQLNELHGQVLALSGVGNWTPVTFSAGNFTVQTGTGTWTVDAADQVAYRTMLINKLLHVHLTIDASTIAGVVNQLRVQLPTGMTGANVHGGPCVVYDNSTTVPAHGHWLVQTGGAGIAIMKGDGTAFTASANQTFLRLDAALEVQ